MSRALVPNVDLQAAQYASFRHDFNRRDEDKNTIDYSSSVAIMEVRQRSNNALILQVSSVPTTGSRIILGDTDPNIQIRVTQADMAAIALPAADDYYDYDIQIRPELDADDFNTETIVQGMFKIDPGITQGIP